MTCAFDGLIRTGVGDRIDGHVLDLADICRGLLVAECVRPEPGDRRIERRCQVIDAGKQLARVGRQFFEDHRTGQLCRSRGHDAVIPAAQVELVGLGLDASIDGVQDGRVGLGRYEARVGIQRGHAAHQGHDGLLVVSHVLLAVLEFVSVKDVEGAVA